MTVLLMSQSEVIQLRVKLAGCSLYKETIIVKHHGGHDTKAVQISDDQQRNTLWRVFTKHY